MFVSAKVSLDSINSETGSEVSVQVWGLPIWCDMRTYTSEEFIGHNEKRVSVSVSLGEIDSENKSACEFYVAKVSVPWLLLCEKRLIHNCHHLSQNYYGNDLFSILRCTHLERHQESIFSEAQAKAPEIGIRKSLKAPVKNYSAQ